MRTAAISILSTLSAFVLTLDLSSLDLSMLLIVVIDVSNNSVVSIENASDLLQSGPLGLDVEEVDEDELDSDPDLNLDASVS